VKILLTGASSFTGYWFAATLAAAGHDIVAPLRGNLDSPNDAERSVRVRRLRGKVELVAACAFGSAKFLSLARIRDFDVLCHHGAEVGDYRNPDFDIAGAAAANTLNLRGVLQTMGERGLKGVVLTGSIFEHDEGAGSQPLTAFSPYGVSKGLTAQIVRHRCHEIGMPFGKFVIPNPFGPLEQPRLGAYLARTWAAGRAAEIKTPGYIRDNIEVGLLAACYRRFVEDTDTAPAFRKLNPSGYVESQGAFVERAAREIGRRTGRRCAVTLLPQTQFPEPLMRVNTDPAARYAAGWDEEAAWDEYASAFVLKTAAANNYRKVQ
jgi:UDP-glucose 4-epimerase